MAVSIFKEIFLKKIETKQMLQDLGLKKKEIEAISFAFDVYDFRGDGTVDAFYAGDLLRRCNLNPTTKTITLIGGEETKGKKTLFLNDIYPMYQACRDSKDGGFINFVFLHLFYWTILLFIVWSCISSFYD